MSDPSAFSLDCFSGVGIIDQVTEILGAPQIDLVGTDEGEAALLGQSQERVVHHGGAELTGQVVAHHWQAGILKALEQ